MKTDFPNSWWSEQNPVKWRGFREKKLLTFPPTTVYVSGYIKTSSYLTLDVRMKHFVVSKKIAQRRHLFSINIIDKIFFLFFFVFISFMHLKNYLIVLLWSFLRFFYKFSQWILQENFFRFYNSWFFAELSAFS